MSAHVYALECRDGSIYTGHTEEIATRLAAHRAGRVRWTRSRQPLALVYQEACVSREEAVARERKLKTGFGRKALKRMVVLQERGLPAAPNRFLPGAAQAGKTVGAGVITEVVK